MDKRNNLGEWLNSTWWRLYEFSHNKRILLVVDFLFFFLGNFHNVLFITITNGQYFRAIKFRRKLHWTAHAQCRQLTITSLSLNFQFQYFSSLIFLFSTFFHSTFLPSIFLFSAYFLYFFLFRHFSFDQMTANRMDTL